MGSSVYSSFLLTSILSGKMTLKTIVVLCLALVVFIEADPVPGRRMVSGDSSWEDVGGRKKRSPGEIIDIDIGDLDREKNWEWCRGKKIMFNSWCYKFGKYYGFI